MSQTQPYKRSPKKSAIDPETLEVVKKKPEKKQTWCNGFINPSALYVISCVVLCALIVVPIIIYVYRVELGLVKSAKDEQKASVESEQSTGDESVDDGRITVDGFKTRFPDSLIFGGLEATEKNRVMEKALNLIDKHGAKFVMFEFDGIIISENTANIGEAYSSSRKGDSTKQYEVPNDASSGMSPTICVEKDMDMTKWKYYEQMKAQFNGAKYFHTEYCVNPEFYAMVPNLIGKEVIVYSDNEKWKPAIENILNLIELKKYAASVTFIFKVPGKGTSMDMIRQALEQNIENKIEFEQADSFIGFSVLAGRWGGDFDSEQAKEKKACPPTTEYKNSELVESTGFNAFEGGKVKTTWIKMSE